MALGAKTPIAVVAFALLLPMAAGRGLRVVDLAAAGRAIEPPRTDTLPPALHRPLAPSPLSLHPAPDPSKRTKEDGR